MEHVRAHFHTFLALKLLVDVFLFNENESKCTLIHIPCISDNTNKVTYIPMCVFVFDRTILDSEADKFERKFIAFLPLHGRLTCIFFSFTIFEPLLKTTIRFWEILQIFWTITCLKTEKKKWSLSKKMKFPIVRELYERPQRDSNTNWMGSKHLRSVYQPRIVHTEQSDTTATAKLSVPYG